MSKITHIVYPYIVPRDKTFGWELIYSIRSLYKNFKENFDITIIGEIPDWVDRDEVTCIEFDNFNIDAQRQTKINQKILKACELYDEFLVFNDDIYLMYKLSLNDLKQPRHINNLRFTNRKFKEPNSFTAQMKNAYFQLKDNGRQHLKNYVSHLPHFYETSKIKEIQKVIDLAPLKFPSVVFENVYHNFFGEQGMPAKGFRWGCYGPNCNQPEKEKVWNHDERGAGKNPWIKEKILEKFNEKCKAEK